MQPTNAGLLQNNHNLKVYIQETERPNMTIAKSTQVQQDFNMFPWLLLITYILI